MRRQLLSATGTLAALMCILVVPVQVRAQGKTAVVTVALARETGAATEGQVRRYKDDGGSGVIVVGPSDMTAEGIARLISGYGAVSQRVKDVGKKDMVFRVRSDPTRRPPLSPKQRARYERIIDSLRGAPLQEVRGVGQTRAIQVTLLGVLPPKSGR